MIVLFQRVFEENRNAELVEMQEQERRRREEKMGQEEMREQMKYSQRAIG